MIIVYHCGSTDLGISLVYGRDSTGHHQTWLGSPRKPESVKKMDGLEPHDFRHRKNFRAAAGSLSSLQRVRPALPRSCAPWLSRLKIPMQNFRWSLDPKFVESLNVPIFHITQPWMVDGQCHGYFFRWCPLYSQNGTGKPTPEFCWGNFMFWIFSFIATWQSGFSLEKKACKLQVKPFLWSFPETNSGNVPLLHDSNNQKCSVSYFFKNQIGIHNVGYQCQPMSPSFGWC